MWSANISIVLAGITLVVGLVVGFALAVRGSTIASYFLWSWVALAMGAILLLPSSSRTTNQLIIVGFLLCVLVLFLSSRYNLERLEQSHNETRRVLADSNNRVEEERRALAGVLHDDLNPLILICRNEAQRLQKMLPDEGEAQAIAGKISELLSEAYKSTRELIRNTRIEIIDSIGFTAAVESLVGHYRSCFEKPVIVLQHNLPPKPALPQAVAINAYKILREAVFNAIKHSGANEIRITIRQSSGGQVFRIDVSDDGDGLSWNATDAGIGLIDMRERARVLGAELHIGPAQNALKRPGVHVSFEFSLPDVPQESGNAA